MCVGVGAYSGHKSNGGSIGQTPQPADWPPLLKPEAVCLLFG